MRIEQVPVDMSSEQKVILGIVSMRQLIYLIVGGTFIYTVFPIMWGLLDGFDFYVKIGGGLIPCLPVLAIVGYLGFLKNSKYNMFYDYYWLIRLGEKSQYGTWRKGSRE
ncbi:PrgI family protein [Stenotrophomonas maltophilia group sp. RNC7]|uniref:PrgI family mobile element protein n=1 Tax=Stenotrophomonas maltophilia group sp. RNC7 TaxID=3071467 RepID=UPI0027E1B0DC|nr:PrgI family protein [Stenotrophomonas maltophilia group sp. RNC7]MDQ4682671.1 PrgI family protein [Stenotrophomonas maltophilia group sp. RNC7]